MIIILIVSVVLLLSSLYGVELLIQKQPHARLPHYLLLITALGSVSLLAFQCGSFYQTIELPSYKRASATRLYKPFCSLMCLIDQQSQTGDAKQVKSLVHLFAEKCRTSYTNHNAWFQQFPNDVAQVEGPTNTVSKE